MDSTALLELFDHHERFHAYFPNHRRVEGALTVRMVGLFEGGHDYVIHSRLTDADADAAIDRELAWFAGRGRKFEWKLYSHDGPKDLKERLASHGFAIGGDEAVMALDLVDLPPELAASHPHDVRRVMDDQGLADYAAVSAALWPEDDQVVMEGIVTTLRSEPERMSAWVAYADGMPVCAARIDFPADSPFSSLWGGSTLEAYRRRGIYTAILSARAKEAVARGYRFLTIDASAMSRPIVARHGFHLLAISNPCLSPLHASDARS